MNKSIKKIAIIAAMTPAMAFAQEELPAEETASAEVVAEAVEASAENIAADAAIKIDADEVCENRVEEFAQRKREKNPLFAFGRPDSHDITYYYEIEAVSSKGAADPDFLKKRQMAYARAFLNLRLQRIRYSLRSYMDSTEIGGLMQDGEANRQQSKSDVDAIKRMGEKVRALSEAKLDKALQEEGVDPAKFGNVAAKRKALSSHLIRESARRAVGSSVGIAVVQTFEGRGTDGQYSVGVIASFDPERVAIVDCMRRKVRPAVLPKKNGIPVATLLASDRITENFGTRFYYDEKGNPSLLSFGQWSANITPDMDRYERKLLEKSAIQQAEAQANIDMNNFIAGAMVLEESTKAGEKYESGIIYDDEGCPVGRSTESDITDYTSWSATTTAKDSMGGRSRVFARTIRHPDSAAMITIVGVNWSFATLDQLRREEEASKPKKAIQEKPIEKKPVDSSLRQGDVYDF